MRTKWKKCEYSGQVRWPEIANAYRYGRRRLWVVARANIPGSYYILTGIRVIHWSRTLSSAKAWVVRQIRKGRL